MLRRTMALRILLCDDQPDIVQSLAMLFDSQGYETAICYDGAEAIAKARTWKPHLAFLDIGLPDVSGYEVAAQIRRMPFGKDVTLVAFTGYGKPEDLEQAKEAGFDRHVKKGGDPVVLVEIAARLTRNRG
jgi:two-component system, sensor histidine kinase